MVGLVSGGKDSLYVLQTASDLGADIVCLANLHPAEVGFEIDSWMYQSVASECVPAIAEAMQVALVRREIKGKQVQDTLEYEAATTSTGESLSGRTSAGAHDETEDLFFLLQDVKKKFPEVTGVTCGALFSDYQRLRVESVCTRLGLVSYAYLWKIPQLSVLEYMNADPDFDARLVKVCSMGLGRAELGKTIRQLTSKFQALEKTFGFHPCGEGGEYETICVRSKLYNEQKILPINEKVVEHDVENVWYLRARTAEVEKDSVDRCPTYASCVAGELESNTFYRAALTLQKKSLSTQWARTQQNLLGGQKLDEEYDVFPTLWTTGSLDVFTVLGESKWEEARLMDAVEQAGRVFRYVRDEFLAEGSSPMFVELQLANIAEDFARVNSEYVRVLFPNNCSPPARCCYQTELPAGIRVRIRVIGAKKLGLLVVGEDSSDEEEEVIPIKVATTHVQSVSGWAMACIGPYSQGAGIERSTTFYSAGVLGLEPHRMALPSEEGGDFVVSLHHCGYRPPRCLVGDEVDPQTLSRRAYAVTK